MFILTYLGHKTYDVDGTKYEREAFINPYTDKVYNVEKVYVDKLEVGCSYRLSDKSVWDFSSKGIKFSTLNLERF